MKITLRLLAVGFLLSFGMGCCAMRGGCQTPLNAAAHPPQSAFTRETLTISGRKWPLYSLGGDGTPVLILHEIDGLSRGCLVLARELAESPGRHRVYLPLMFGKWNANAAPRHLLSFVGGRSWGSRWDLRKPDSLGTVVDEAAALCREISRRHGGQRVVVIGSCLTGSWPVALLREPCVAGGIVCQPALPLLPGSDEAKRGLGIPGVELEAAVAAAKRENKSLLGFCYLEDKFTPDAMLMKFERLKRAFGNRFTPCLLARKEDRNRVPDWAEWMEAADTREHSTLTRNAGLTSNTERGELLERTKTFIDQAQ